MYLSDAEAMEVCVGWPPATPVTHTIKESARGISLALAPNGYFLLSWSQLMSEPACQEQGPGSPSQAECFGLLSWIQTEIWAGAVG